jgi:serine/threonine protein kinase
LENILIDDDGYLVLTDFGIAKHLKVNEKAYTVCGTPEYMSPEMLNGKGYNKMTDWWSFGIIMYININPAMK